MKKRPEISWVKGIGKIWRRENYFASSVFENLISPSFKNNKFLFFGRKKVQFWISSCFWCVNALSTIRTGMQHHSPTTSFWKFSWSFSVQVGIRHDENTHWWYDNVFSKDLYNCSNATCINSEYFHRLQQQII